jgi:predicted ATPase/DNA-binding CsgD family transcriptional regulator
MSDLNDPLLLDPLTDRELDILTLIDQGLSNPEIAGRLIIGLETVRWYTKQIYSKLGVHSRTQAIYRARELRLLSTGETAPAPLGVSARQDNLPTYTTPFIGREDEAAELTSLLQDPSVRLITVVGPGGMGKTRLCAEVARNQVDNFQDGVCFVSMLTVQSASEMDLALAAGIGLRLSDDGATRAQLLSYLQPRQMLLVLDNFERVVDDAELVTAIVKSAPQIKLLVTSQMSLNLRDEWVRYLGPLAVPSSDNLAGIESYGAIRLFYDCVRRVRGDFLLADHLPAVLQICRLVQGIPLAIELAATWLKTLSVEDVAREIQQNFDFLATKQRDVEERHRSIEAVFEYSWNLLTDDEQRTFRRLSVFRGQFGFPAAEQVAGASIHMLSELVGKSLLQQHSTGLYEIHSLLYEYAVRKLENPSNALMSIRSSELQAWAALTKGKFDRVEQVAKEVLRLTSDQANSPDKGFALSALGVLAGIETDYARCRQLCEAGQALIKSDIIAVILAHLGLSIAYCGFDDCRGAKHHIHLALQNAITLRIPAFSILCLPVIAVVLAFEDKPEQAVELMGLAFTHPDSTLDWIKKWPLIGQIDMDLEAELGSADYAAAWERGQILDVEQVVQDLLAQ